MKTIFKHPLYRDFGSDRSGNCYKIDGMVEIKQYISAHHGYFFINFTPEKNVNLKLRVHRFVYECMSQKILPKIKLLSGGTMVVDHINENKLDNRMCNLQILTISENVTKSHRYKGHRMGMSTATITKTNSKKEIKIIRENNRKNAKNYRKKHLKKQREYGAAYQKLSLKDPVKYKCHREFNFLVNLRLLLRANSFKKNMLSDVLRKRLLEAKDTIYFVHHIISLSHMLNFNINLPRFILHDSENIKILSVRSSNYNYISNDALKLAKRLESKYSVELAGFYAWLKLRQNDFKRKGGEL